jgi:crotonobetainyl-CoA:carnitine CoA-transferase CaiB-like acyl-CoA transferase
MSGPLDGVRVVELGQFQQGPAAAMRLGDLGADVIKVEAPTGDPGRGMLKIVEADGDLDGRGINYYFEGHNRNKRSITLDLKKEEGLEVFFKLIEWADVFVNNLSINAPDRMGIGYEVLRKRNPRLIYAHTSGWGRNGPDADALSFDYTGIARCGTMMICGERGSTPQAIVPGTGDELGALMCAFAVCAALYAREKTGKGQRIDTSLMSGLIAMERLILSAPAFLGQEYRRWIRAKAGNATYNHYKCKDDKWIVIAHLQPDRYWPNVCKALGIEELEHDPRFNSIEARKANAEELVSIFDKKFAAKTRAQWLEIFKKENVICAPIQTTLEVVNDPQALANEYIIEVDDPVRGKTKQVGFPWMFSQTPASVRRVAPGLGEHTDEILLDLGYGQDDIAKLRQDSVI